MELKGLVMGYRSEVTIAMASKTKDALDAFIAPRLLQKEIASNKEYFERSEYHDSVLVFHVDEWKWYDSYPDVQAILELMHEVPTYGGAYRFMRIGEDIGDIEQTCSYGEVDADGSDKAGNDCYDLLDSFRLVSIIEADHTFPLEF
jgi:hypothetical protein